MITVNRFTKWLAKTLHPRLRRLAHSRSPDVFIGGKTDPYLLRWHVVPRNPLFNIYLHRFMRSDDDRALHDHPWASVSLSISGHLLEIYGADQQRRMVLPGDLVFRGGRFSHRMVVSKPGAMTLFVTGPRFRAWGFHCPRGWIHHRQFTRPTDSAQIGRGCD